MRERDPNSSKHAKKERVAKTLKKTAILEEIKLCRKDVVGGQGKQQRDIDNAAEAGKHAQNGSLSP